MSASIKTKLNYLFRKRFGYIDEPTGDGNIFNFASYKPSLLEARILAHSLDFCISFSMPDFDIHRE